MWTDPAWSQRALEALREMFAIDNHQRKVWIEFLFDEGFWDRDRLSWDAAIARWNDNLNPGKPAFWKPSELWALASRFGRHHLFLAQAEDLGYEVRRRPTEERRQQLLEHLAEQMDATERALSDARAQLARLQEAPTDRTVTPLRTSPRAFSLDGEELKGPGNF